MGTNLVLKDRDKTLKFTTFDNDREMEVIAEDENGEQKYYYFHVSQTRELIEHLTNCLKEVENG